MTTTETALERTVREEQEAHERALREPGDMHFDHNGDDVAEADTPLEDETGQTAIIDRSAYEREDLQIPKIDGQTIDRIKIDFGGSIFLDRSEASDVAVYNALQLGKDVQLLVTAKCSKTGASGATDREGNLDVVVGGKTLKVHSLSKPAGADWVQEASA